jgi:glycerol-3-phosphate acyltransferase PlsY
MTTAIAISFILVFLASYLIGSIPFGFLIGKICGKDIRKLGSCNIGATNVTRTVGKFAGRVCFILDFLKGFAPVFVVSLLVNKKVIDDYYQLPQIIAALGAVIGHMFTIFLKFKGGKGVSTSAGTLLAMAPLAFLISGVVWVVVFLVGRYVSLASIAAAAVLPVSATLLSILEVYPTPWVIVIFLYLLAILAILRHTSNIRRLLNGTESRFDKKKKSETKEKQEEKSDENSSSE